MANNGRFSQPTRDILIVAQNEADERRHNFIDTDHIILAIVGSQSSVGAPQILRDNGASYDTLSDLVGKNPYETSSKRLELSRDAKQMLENAVVEMKRKGEIQITSEHLLIGLLQIETSAGVELLFQSRCNIKKLYATMDVSLPERVIRQHKQQVNQATETLDEGSEKEGCIPSLVNRIRQLFTRG